MNFTSLTTAIALDTFLDSHPLFKHAYDVWKETKDYENAIKFEPFTILRDKSSSEKEIFLGEVLVSNDHKNWFKLNHMFLPLGKQYNGDYVKIPSFYESEYTVIYFFCIFQPTLSESSYIIALGNHIVCISDVIDVSHNIGNIRYMSI